MMRAPEQPRAVSQGAHGRDIVAYKGGLIHAKVRPPGNTNPTFGHKMRGQVIMFQRVNGLRTDGVIGRQTYSALVVHIGDYGRHLLESVDKELQARTVQQRVVQNALWSCQAQLQPYWIYDQLRPWPYWQPFRTVDSRHVVRTDCSGFAGMVAKWSGAPTPFPSYGYTGIGNTDTMLAELPSVAVPAPGDLILYSNPGHVVICVDYPYAVSFGAEPGPIKIDSRYRPATGYRRFIR